MTSALFENNVSSCLKSEAVTWHCHCPLSYSVLASFMMRLQSPHKTLPSHQYLSINIPTGLSSFSHLHSPALFLTRQVRWISSQGFTSLENGCSMNVWYLYFHPIHRIYVCGVKIKFVSCEMLDVRNILIYICIRRFLMRMRTIRCINRLYIYIYSWKNI